MNVNGIPSMTMKTHAFCSNLVLPLLNAVLSPETYDANPKRIQVNYLLFLVPLASNGAVQASEVIDLVNASSTCQNWEDFPVGLYGSVGEIIHDRLTLCGGAALLHP